jgi:exopolysaccharide biosynthesis polyprenyl glycosylphosphotransferase
MCFHSYLRRSSLVERLRQRVLFIGWNKEARRVAETFILDRASAYVPAGYLPTAPNVEPRVNGSVLRTFSSDCDLESLLNEEVVDSVIVADPNLPKDQVMRIANTCELELVSFQIIPSYFKILVSGLHLETMNGIPILGVSRLPLDRWLNLLIKRLLDIVGSLVGLVFSAPVILLFGALVYIESPGPIIYRQRRHGRNGKPFWMFKIRSMHVCAEENGRIGWTKKNDPRCLRVGRFMRRWNIDELPQFWNVLQGEMSLVGPRPERPELVRSFKGQIPHYQPRHRIRPGMTGWAQVNGFRGDTDLTKRIACDLFYLENWTVALDLQIMAMTFLSKNNGY